MGEWISVEERLPDDREHVLIWYVHCHYGDSEEDYYDYAIACYDHLEERWFGLYPLGAYPRIKYWMPLPKAPKSEVEP